MKGYCTTIVGVLILVLAIWDIAVPLKWASWGFLVLGIVLLAHESSSCCKPRMSSLAMTPSAAPKRRGRPKK
ncbi:MAG TPA: hypothetical protein VJB08_02305 [Candidatus Nanoarchaeia archaeon]|nr:hypothetical protein [Candidatus Nanoarchaeia archaeon]